MICTLFTILIFPFLLKTSDTNVTLHRIFLLVTYFILITILTIQQQTLINIIGLVMLVFLIYKFNKFCDSDVLFNYYSQGPQDCIYMYEVLTRMIVFLHFITFCSFYHKDQLLKTNQLKYYSNKNILNKINLSQFVCT